MKCSSIWFAPILIASTLLLSAAASSTPSREPAAKGQTEQTQRHKLEAESSRSQAQTTPVRAAIKPVPLQKPVHERTSPTGEQKADYVWLGLLVNGVIACGTLILAVVGICQSRAARDAAIQAGKQTEALEKTLAATEKAADAALKSAHVAETQLRQAERGWVAFEVVGMQGAEYIFSRLRRLHPRLREPDDSTTVEIIRLRIQYRFNNGGRTPVRLISGSVEFVSRDPRTLPVEPVYADDQETSESLLSPGNSATNSLVLQMFPPRFEAFVLGREALIIFGFVKYRDIVASGEAAEHETRFRMECHFPGFVQEPNGDISAAGPIYFASNGPEAYNRYT